MSSICSENTFGTSGRECTRSASTSSDGKMSRAIGTAMAVRTPVKTRDGCKQRKMNMLGGCVNCRCRQFASVFLSGLVAKKERQCLKNACVNDVHMTSPHDNHDHDHDHDHLHDTTTKGWRFGDSSRWMSHNPSGSRQGHPRHIVGPLRRKAVGGPINAPQGAVTHNDGALRRDKGQVFLQTDRETSAKYSHDATHTSHIHHPAVEWPDRSAT